MSIQGHSKTMPLPDLFQWIGGSRKTGGMRIVHHQATTRLACEAGCITSCSSDDPPKLLGQFLLFHGALTEDLLRHAMAEQEETGDSLSDILVAMGAVTSDDLERLVEKKAREAIIGLFDWRRSRFASTGPSSWSPRSCWICTTTN